MTDLAPDEEYRKAQEAEYGQFVATKAIDIRGARAFNEGDPVPASHVKNGVVSKDDVAKVGTKAAEAATGNEG